MIRILIDVNLSPSWVPVFAQHDIQAIHWSSVGDIRSPDGIVLAWAREHDYVVFTHDLDYGAILAWTSDSGPSVIQVRTHDVLPEHLEPVVIAAIRQYHRQLEIGAIVTVEESRGRVRPSLAARSRRVIVRSRTSAMKNVNTYNVACERDESGWWVASVREVDGCHTQGRSVDEARRRIREAMALFVEDARSATFVDDVKLSSRIR